MTDLVERLKAPMPRHLFFPIADALCMEAAAEITRLQQKCADLEADYLRRHNDAVDRFLENTRLQKELETALEALERLVTTYEGMEDGNGDPCPDVAHAKTVIRALKDKEVADG